MKVEIRENYASLTPREREVMVLVTSGLLNKQVGGELGITEITVKAHRGQVMRKMGARLSPCAREHGRDPRPGDGADSLSFGVDT